MKKSIIPKRKKAKRFFRKLFSPFLFALLVSSFSFDLPAQSATDFLILAEKIRNGSEEEKRDILFQIRNIRSERASRLALPALRDSSEIVRAAAAGSSIFLPAAEAIQALAPLFSDRSVFVRREAAYALGKTRSPLAVNDLLRVLQRDEEQIVKTAAAIALGEIGDVSAAGDLTRILQKKYDSGEEFLRRSAARSLGQIAHFQQFGEHFTPEGEIFLKTDSAAATNQSEYKDLIEIFPALRPANEALIRVLQNPRESNDTKREAAFALGAIGDESSIRVLQSNLNPENPYLAAISKASLDKIEKALELKNKTVK